MKHLTIAISREYGSGGLQIGEAVAKRLGLPIYDRNRIDQIAHERGLDQLYIFDWHPHVCSTAIWGADDPKQRGWGRQAKPYYYTNEQTMFSIQSQLIYELAEAGPCVFVGRCADYVLKHQPCLRVFIHADEDSRALRIYNEYLVRTGYLAEKIWCVDRGRAAYYKRNTGHTWGDRTRYHLFLDSGFLDMEGCVEAILSAAQKLMDKAKKRA